MQLPLQFADPVDPPTPKTLPRNKHESGLDNPLQDHLGPPVVEIQILQNGWRPPSIAADILDLIEPEIASFDLLIDFIPGLRMEYTPSIPDSTYSDADPLLLALCLPCYW